MTTEIDRRAALVAPLVAAALCQGEAMAQSTPPPACSYEPRQMPFAASAVSDLSERLLTSHWQNVLLVIAACAVAGLARLFIGDTMSP